MKVIGHRGAPYEALENTWTSFEKAWEGGAERLELDVHLSKDGHPVIMHDANLKRTTGIDRKINQLNRSELESIKTLSDEPIPFLDQLLDRYLNRCELNLEIKDTDPKCAQMVGSMVHRHRNRDSVIISSFHIEVLEQIAWEYPALSLACLWGMGDFHWPHLANWAPPVMMQRCGAKIFHPYIGLCDERVMDYAKARQWLVYPYAGLANGDERDQPERLWQRLKDLGVDGLCTNFPRQLRQWLEGAK